MPVCEWNDTYALGIELIDQHHRQLFTLLNISYDAFVPNADPVAVEGVIEELMNYATYHFSAEEQMMERDGFPGLVEHLSLHEGFIREIRVLQRESMAGKKSLSLELIVFLKDWLQDHISVSDRVYTEFLGLQAEAAPGVQLQLG